MYYISPWLVFIKDVFLVKDEQRPKKKVDHPHIAIQDDRYFSICQIWIVIGGKSVVTKRMETRKVYCELHKMWKGTFRTHVSSFSFLKTLCYRGTHRLQGDLCRYFHEGSLQTVQVVVTLSASHVLQKSPRFIVQGVEVWTPRGPILGADKGQNVPRSQS